MEHDLIDHQDLEEMLRDGRAEHDLGVGRDQAEVLHGGPLREILALSVKISTCRNLSLTPPLKC